MRTIIARFFYILGAIFFALILAGAYLYLADPFGLRTLVPLVRGNTQSNTEKTAGPAQNDSSPNEDSHPYLTEKQESVLETVGIDPSVIPTSISDEQKTCLVNAVGEARADEIQAGALPTMKEIFKAKSCF